MFTEIKYVIAISDFGVETPILFGGLINHDSITNNRVVSAGFVSFIPTSKGMKIEVYGGSVSLNLKSNPDDAKLICKMLNYNESDNTNFITD